MSPNNKFIFLLFWFYCLLIGGFLNAQNHNTYALELSAFDKKVDLNYFEKMDNSKIYEVLDLNDIYRYWIDCKDKESAEKLRQEAINKGFINARIIDFKALEEHCKNTCGYTPPKVTNRGNNTTYKLNPDTRSPYSNTTNTDNTANNSTTDNYKIPTNEDFKKEDKNAISEDWKNNTKFDPAKDKIECLFYDYKSPYLRDLSKKELDKVAIFLLQNKKYTLKIYAHTDGNGSEDFNYKLSETRALIVHKYLIWRGIEDVRINDGPYGERLPIAINVLPDGTDSEEGRQLNRRVELEIYDETGKKINIVNPIIVPEHLRVR